MKKFLALPLILLAGLLLRLYHFTSLSLWHDEAFSALLIRYNWGEMMYRIGLDVHPPFYYIILRIWSWFFGSSLSSLRGFSVFFGVLGIIVLYKFVQKAFNSKGFALTAALLFALNAFQIQFVSQARMYTLGVFLCLLAAYLLVCSLESNQTKKKFVFYTAFGLTVAAGMLTHYYLLFTGAALCFYALVHNYFQYGTKVKKYTLVIGSFIVCGIAFLPWLPEFLVQYKRVGGGYWIPPMDIWSIPQTFWMMLTGLNINIDLTFSRALVVGALLFSLFILYRFVKKTDSHYKWLVVFALVMPFCGAIAFYILAKLKGAQTSVYLIRYFVFASVFYSIVLAGWLNSLKNQTTKNILLAIYCVLCLYGTWTYWKEIDVNTKPGMAAAANYLSNILPSDKIYVGSSSQFFSFTYYNRTNVKPILFTPGINSFEELPHYYGTALLTERDITNALPQKPEGTETAWVVWTDGFYGKKPDVPANWAQISEKSFGEINFYTPPYTIFVTKYKVN